MKKLVSSLSLLAAITALAATGSVPAQAASAASVPVISASVPASATTTSWWTPGRMRAAVPVDGVALAAQAADASAQLPATTVTGDVPETPPLAPPAAAGGSGWKTSPIGKVFFVDGGREYVCSGSVVNTPRGDLVATAGHCVINPRSKAPFANWVFVPGYHDGRAPYGVWAGRRFVVTASWYHYGDDQGDVALAAVAPHGRHQIARVVGAEGWRADLRGYVHHVNVVGYPVAPPYQRNGQQRDCRGLSRHFVWRGHAYNEETVKCRLTGGASGGPWLIWPQRTGLGFVNGVTTTGTGSPHITALQSPYLGRVAAAMFRYAERL